MASGEDEEEWAGIETDESQGSDKNIEPESMGENLAEGLRHLETLARSF